MSLFFNPEHPNVEAEHWMGMCLTSAKFLIEERFGGKVWDERPELGVSLANAMMGFVTAKLTAGNSVDATGLDRIADAIEGKS